MSGQVVPFPRPGGEHQVPHEVLRELRSGRGWSLSEVARAMAACATEEERKSLPSHESLRHNWIRWERGQVEPDGGLNSKPFFKPIIARAFGMQPDDIWPVATITTTTSTPLTAGVSGLRAELLARRDRLAQELAYLNAVLAIPVPESISSR